MHSKNICIQLASKKAHQEIEVGCHSEEKETHLFDSSFVFSLKAIGSGIALNSSSWKEGRAFTLKKKRINPPLSSIKETRRDFVSFKASQ